MMRIAISSLLLSKFFLKAAFYSRLYLDVEASSVMIR